MLLWYRPAATAHIQPLAWEPPYAMGGNLKRQKKTKKRREELVFGWWLSRAGDGAVGEQVVVINVGK